MSDFSQSQSRSSTSSAPPESLPEMIMPSGSMCVQYPIVDPTHVLDNPMITFPNSRSDMVIDDKTASLLLSLLDMYKSLCVLNMTIDIENVKKNITGLKNSEIYNIIDTSFMNSISTLKINSSFLSPEMLPLLISKHEIHSNITKHLKDINSLLTSHHSRPVPGPEEKEQEKPDLKPTKSNTNPQTESDTEPVKNTKAKRNNKKNPKN